MAGDDMTQRKPAKWVVRTGFSSSQSHHPFGEWAATQLKYKRVAAVAAGYALGRGSLGGFQKTFEDAGGQIVQKLRVPLNTTDFAPLIAPIRPATGAVWVLFAGPA